MKRIVVLGGGAAGFFGAIAAKSANPNAEVHLLEKNAQVLAKVRISGGGRCNATHGCFDPKLLVQYYPRGHKALLGPFHQFQPRNTIEWFAARGVPLKEEKDGRMFPVTDSSATIIDCLMKEARDRGVILKTECGAKQIVKTDFGFEVTIDSGEMFPCEALLVAIGSHPKILQVLKGLGIPCIDPVPSLFTFNVPSSNLLDLSGVAVPSAKVTVKEGKRVEVGPLLLTHFGFSGPAVLKLSAWEARTLHELGYKATFSVNWLPELSSNDVEEALQTAKEQFPQRLIANECPFSLPKQLWKRFVELAGCKEGEKYTHLTKVSRQKLVDMLLRSSYAIEGKTTNKEEFVTCGGVDLNSVNFKTMESKIIPGLFFAGEVLDIDGVTGGFNFQAAWTTSWIAGHAMASSL